MKNHSYQLRKQVCEKVLFWDFFGVELGEPISRRSRPDEVRRRGDKADRAWAMVVGGSIPLQKPC
jgi:hypothetical protein